MIRTEARYNHIFNEMSTAGVIEQGQLGIYELFIHHPREYILNNDDSGTNTTIQFCLKNDTKYSNFLLTPCVY